jgi:hypothetical protein
MAVNFNAMILPKFGTAMIEGDTARQNALLKDQQMANTQQEMQFRGEERAYVQRQRAEDEAFMTRLNAEAERAGGQLTPQYITMLAQSRNPQLRATGIEAMERARRLASHNEAVDKLFPKAPEYKPTIGGAQFGVEPPQNYNALIPQGAQNPFSPGAGDQPSAAMSQPQFRTRGEFRGAMANPERATAAMARGMRTVPPELEGLLRNPDTANMAIALLDKQNKGPELQQLHQYAATLDPKSQEYKDVQTAIALMNSPKIQTIMTPGGEVIRAPVTGGAFTVSGGMALPPKVEPLLIDGVPHLVDVNKYRAGSGIGSTVPGYIGPAVPNASQAKVSREQQKLEDSLFSLEENLQDYRSAYERLDKLGGIPTTKDSVAANVANQLANTTAGGWVATALGSEAQVERDTIANTKRLLTQDIAGITGIGSKQLDSNQELQAMLKTLGTPGQSIEAVNATFDSIMRWAQSKVRASRRGNGGGAAPATGGGKPPAAGGGKPDVTGLPAGATLGRATSKGIEVLDSTGKLIGYAQQ